MEWLRTQMKRWLGVSAIEAKLECQVDRLTDYGRVILDLQREIVELKKPRPENPRIRAATYIDWDTAQVMALRDLEKEN